MNDMKRTGIFIAIAAVLTTTALLAVPSRKSPEVFNDQGMEFYPQFDPDKCTSIKMISLDEKPITTRYFNVKRDPEAGWIIPSHQNYPADAQKPLVAAATVVNGLTKGVLQATRAEDHAALGVIDPEANTAVDADKAGMRIVLKDGEKLLCDLIISKEIEGKWDTRYVRRPDSKRVYACKIDVRDLSTRFAGWVETDVLQLASANIKQLRLDAYKVQQVERRVTLVPGEILALALDDKSNWTMAGLAETEELDTSKPSDMRSTLTDLTLVGVRRKHPDVIRFLRQNETFTSDGEVFVRTLMRNVGYHIGMTSRNQMRIVSNEGELRVSCDDGVVYNLLFGKVVYGEPDQVSAASATPKDDKAADPDAKPETNGEHRYLWVTVQYDKSLLGPELVEPVKPALAPETPEKPDDAEKPDEPEKTDDDDEPKKDLQKEYEDALKKYEEDVKERAKKRMAGEKRVKKLEKRFADWYYVVSADAYAKLRVTRTDLVKVKEKPEDEKPESGEHDADDGHGHNETTPDAE